MVIIAFVKQTKWISAKDEEEENGYVHTKHPPHMHSGQCTHA